ncbi:retention module-containing protein, partial [Halomonas sp. 1390]|uniref:retention module-containing protein n=1 Tax=Halomonas sp. B23F22_3 TaxID=3459516 RepID=UPI00373ED237
MTIATIISITGQAWARDASGDLRELRVGDTLQEGETLVTSDNGRVLLDFADGLDPTVIGEGQEVAISADLDAEQPVVAEEASVQDEDLEALLAALEEGEGDLLEGLDATAAGAGGAGGPGGGHDFVRLARITENVDPLAFEYGLASLDEPSELESQALDEVPDAPPSILSITDATEVEGTDLVHVVTLSGPPTVPVTFTFSWNDVEAIGGSDYGQPPTFSNGVTYDSSNGTITVPAGVTSFSVSFAGLGDDIAELAETYVLTVGSQTAIGTIVDNDEPGVSVDPAVDAQGEVVDEGDQAIFTVNVTEAAVGSTLALTLNDGTAAVGDDYEAAFEYSLNGTDWFDYSAPISLPQGGDQQVQVRTQTLDDNVDEPNETYQLTAELSDGTSTVSDTGTATIVDNDEPGVSVDPAVDAQGEVVDEGDQAIFTVNVTEAAVGSTL